MQIEPVIAIHMSAALLATAIGPVALWARRQGATLPRLHRGAGYAWVTLMVLTALSAVFIRHSPLALLGGFSLIHLLIPFTLGMLVVAFRYLFRGNISGHRKTMRNLYVGACAVAGIFTLSPHRLLGQLVWGQWLGLL
ncbi:MAG: DUF2306 domain-containing protein [Rhodoferax sp.]|nr:DUF2306 domain-containing protein [Rhodoferax sp.]